MIRTHRGLAPDVGRAGFIASDAVVAGDVTVGVGSVILSGAVVTAEGGAVRIGDHCVVMEHAVIRGVPHHPCSLGNHVLVGPRAHLSGCSIDDRAFLATGVTVLNGAHIGAEADVRIQATVHVRTRVERGATVPIGWVAVGDPARILPPSSHDEIWAVQKTLHFRDAAFRMQDLPRGPFMERMTERYCRALAEHRHDLDVRAVPEGE